MTKYYLIFCMLISSCTSVNKNSCDYEVGLGLSKFSPDSYLKKDLFEKSEILRNATSELNYDFYWYKNDDELVACGREDKKLNSSNSCGQIIVYFKYDGYQWHQKESDFIICHRRY